jgi:molybdate transport system ATP-binding protein
MGLSMRLKKRLDGFMLDVAWDMDDELVVLFGPSGSGKSLTLQLIAGLIEPDDGYVSANGRVFFHSREGINLVPQERSLGYVFQDRVLFPHMTVHENIAYGLKRRERSSARGKVGDLMRFFHLEGLERKYPDEISGGQKQRVTLARALIGRPDALLLDEPFSALDNVLRLEMRDLLQYIRRQFGVPIVLVTHDMLEAYTMAEKVVLYAGGRVIQAGPPSEVFGQSGNPDVDLFLALNYPLLLAQHP